MKLLSTLLLLVVSYGVHAQYFKVQVAAYVEQMPTKYFTELGVENVYMHTDHNKIYRYFIGDFETRAEAEAKKNDVVSKGFIHASIIDIEAQKALCGAPCPYKDKNKKPSSSFLSEGGGAALDAFEELMINAIFFDFDRSSLKAASITELDKLQEVLMQNDSYNAELLGYTDSKGSPEYNQALSKRRASAAKNYLINKGVSASRISIKTFGESDPIAKNSNDDGSDSPEGRRYNRRVVLVITDSSGQIIRSAMTPIAIPESLKVD